MRIRLRELLIFCRDYHEVIPFAEITYFHGQMGAGKSSIARLVDFCLGGSLDLTPALTSEFVTAQLRLVVAQSDLLLERSRSSTFIRAQWEKDGELHDVEIPARTPAGEVVPSTGVEVLSDLFFYLAGMAPPKVRRSKLREDSELGRLSLRDLLWYCYLDQDSMDSDFFHLDAGADTFKRLKSRDVLRFLLGFHQERVAELEVHYEQLRLQRTKLEAGAEALKQALAGADFSSQMEIDARVRQIDKQREAISLQLAMLRNDVGQPPVHATEELRARGRELAEQLNSAEEAVAALQRVLSDDSRHLNELRTLSTKFRRMTSARAVLNGVEFEACPRCARPLPERAGDGCRVCGQPEAIQHTDAAQIDTTDKDLTARTAEIADSLVHRQKQLGKYEKVVAELRRQKAVLDAELVQVSRTYDSAYLSRAIAVEHERARLDAEASQLERLRVLPEKLDEQMRRATELSMQEAEVRAELKVARGAAEQDAGNLRELETLFLDCLTRARIPGFNLTDVVQMRSPTFVPEVSTPEEKDLISTSFANLGSGGKKTLFKCCFALAMHRLAAKTGAALPTLLIIDSPMKNISERENREQFEGFHELVYMLKTTELKDIQFVLIDKEFLLPSADLGVEVLERRMTPSQPLLRGFKPGSQPKATGRDTDESIGSTTA